MRIFLYFIFAFVGFFVFVRLTERKMVYFPTKDVEGSPADMGMPEYETVSIRSKDGIRLHGWFVKAEGSGLAAIFFHGNAGNVSHRLEKLRILHELGVSVLLIDYRGYGRSEGAPDEPGLYRDAEAAYRYLTVEKGISSERVVLYGESLGGAVAVDLAQRFPAGALILEGAFTSAHDMARHAFAFVPRFLLATRFDSLSKVKSGAANLPTLVIHSANDEIVPYWMGEKLFEASAGPKKMLRLRGGHNTAFVDSAEMYRVGLHEFLEALTKSRIRDNS